MLQSQIVDTLYNTVTDFVSVFDFVNRPGKSLFQTVGNYIYYDDLQHLNLSTLKRIQTDVKVNSLYILSQSLKTD